MSTPEQPDPADAYLQRLGHWRSRSRPAVGDLQFIRKQFERDVARPHRQLGEMGRHWQQHVPPALAEQTTLLRFRGGTLHVAVPDSATHYQLDRALRSGALRQLRAAFKGNLRQVRIEVRADP